jgi:hypothetical protein
MMSKGILGLVIPGLLLPVVGAMAQAPAEDGGKSAIADLGRRYQRQQQRLSAAQNVSPVERWLNQIVEGPIEWDERAFLEVIEEMQEAAEDINIYVEWRVLEGAGVDIEAPITLKLKKIPRYELLRIILRQAGEDIARLGYRATGNILTISTVEELDSRMVLRTYPVRDLAWIRRITDYYEAPGIQLSQLQQAQFGGGGGGGSTSSLFTDDDDDQEEIDWDDMAEEIITKITQAVAPETWQQNGGLGTIVNHNDILIVNNSVRVHELLGGPVREMAFRGRAPR